MKRRLLQLLIPLPLLLLFSDGCEQEPPINSSQRFVYLATHLSKLQLVTPQRIVMEQQASVKCDSIAIASLKQMEGAKATWPMEGRTPAKPDPRHPANPASPHRAELQVYISSAH